ncbi:MAG: hypothetical protein ACRD0D_13875 [Acidimicrobiales bacterium]
MAIDERSRHELHLQLEQVLGPEAATTLMEHLPPVGWADVATKRDLDQLRAATKGDLDQLRAATKGDLDQLRAEVGQLRIDTKKDFGQLRADTKKDLDQLRADTKKDLAGVRSEIEHLEKELRLQLDASEQRLLATLRKDLISQTNAQTRAMILTMTTSILGVAGIAFAAARLV